MPVPSGFDAVGSAATELWPRAAANAMACSSFIFGGSADNGALLGDDTVEDDGEPSCSESGLSWSDSGESAGVDGNKSDGASPTEAAG